jgi:hypothetical protein
MAPPNKIDTLPEPIREKAYELLRAGATVDTIVAALNDLGADVSRAGTGRWKKRQGQQMKAFQRQQTFAAAIAKGIEEDPKGNLVRALVELGNTAIMDRLLERGDDEESEDARPIDEKALFLLTSSIKNLASASNMNTARELKIRKDVLEKAAKAVDQVAKTRGLTPDAVAEIRSKILGVAA